MVYDYLDSHSDVNKSTNKILSHVVVVVVVYGLRGMCLSTSFPGSFLSWERSWLGLVTCHPDSRSVTNKIIDFVRLFWRKHNLFLSTLGWIGTRINLKHVRHIHFICHHPESGIQPGSFSRKRKKPGNEVVCVLGRGYYNQKCEVQKKPRKVC